MRFIDKSIAVKSIQKKYLLINNWIALCKKRKKMTIYFYTLQKNVCRKIAERLEEGGHICCIYTDMNDFYNALLNMKEFPDLLLIDYLTYDHNTFNIYRYMREVGCLIPLIFYNNPFPPNGNMRVKHWRMLFNLYYSDIKTIDIESYTSVFECVGHVIESEELKPYISLLQPPKPYPCEVAAARTIDEDIRHLDEYLPASLHRLLKILFEHRRETLSMSKLQQLLGTSKAGVARQTIYSDISRLRKHLRSHARIKIERVREGYRLTSHDEKHG